MKYVEALHKSGFALLPNVLDTGTTERLCAVLSTVQLDTAVKQRAGRAFGIRRLLEVVPDIRELAESAAIRALIEPVTGAQARVIRGIFFDKTPVANWKVPWHQDVMIAVRARKDIEGFNAWSVKAGVIHVQPPVEVLDSIIALRLHLDDTSDANGALRVIPGSHQQGILNDEEIQRWKGVGPIVTCVAPRGTALLLRPLLLHASSIALQPTQRRVLHLEYSAMELPNGLEWYGS